MRLSDGSQPMSRVNIDTHLVDLATGVPRSGEPRNTTPTVDISKSFLGPLAWFARSRASESQRTGVSWEIKTTYMCHNQAAKTGSNKN